MEEAPRPTNPMVTQLLTDLYQFTMVYAYWKAGKHLDHAVSGSLIPFPLLLHRSVPLRRWRREAGAARVGGGAWGCRREWKAEAEAVGRAGDGTRRRWRRKREREMETVGREGEGDGGG
ncbi:hypothetical protein OsJ_36155 [Oryza sativa Japonica Group]|uniref:Uncharacterized protein n=1 Tax=Oryza sativa subsp. japonica TaxID=39947 RepID=B9GD88_ORYSJ|nr:hypothetical protein OsJ_36155 [Oryza sativa Japonica Group]